MWKDNLHKVTHAGVLETTKIHEKYKLVSLNKFILATAALGSLWGILFLFAEWYTASFFIVFVEILFISVIILNYNYKYTFSKIMLVLSTNISIIGVTAILGYHTGFYLYLFTAPLFIFWLFDLEREKLYVLMSTLSYFSCYIITLFLKKGFAPIVLVNTSYFQFSIYDLNIILALGFSIFLFNNYTTYFFILRKQLIKEQDKLKNEITLRRKDQKRLKKLYEKIKITNINLEQFGFIVSHNIRAPFANIKGFLDLYEPKAIDQTENQEVVECIYKSVNNLDGVLNDLGFLLTLRKDLEEERETILFSSLIEGIKQSLSFALKYEKIVIQEDFLPTLKINTVRTIIHSIVFNLVQNAIKYRKENEPSEIIVNVQENAKEYTLCIADNGIGIDLEKYKDQIFNLYKKINSEGEGKGVGLYMVKTQVHLLGGDIRVESTLGMGTSFIITLPKLNP